MGEGQSTAVGVQHRFVEPAQAGTCPAKAALTSTATRCPTCRLLFVQQRPGNCGVRLAPAQPLAPADDGGLRRVLLGPARHAVRKGHVLALGGLPPISRLQPTQ